MPKNAMQRLQKIENDLKTVISIYDVCNKCKNSKSKTQDDDLQLPQISSQEVMTIQEPSQFDFSNNTVNIAKPQDVYSTESVQGVENWAVEKSAPLSFSTLSTICEVSYVKTKKTEGSTNYEKQGIDNDVINKFSNGDSIKGKEKRNVIAGKSRFVSSKLNSTLKEYPDWLFHTTSNCFGSVKHSYNRKDKCYSLNSNAIAKNVPRSEEKSRVKNKVNEKDFSRINDEKEFIQRGNTDSDKKEKKTQKTIENGEPCTIDLSKMIEKSNEKLEKMKVSKELALNIAKHLKEKYDEIQQSKRELTETLLKVQKDNEIVKNELQDAQLKIEQLRESKTIQIEQEVKNKEIMKETVQKLNVRISELEKELIEREQEIEKIQRARLTEITNELKNKESQARDIQRLSNEKCQLLAANEELVILLTDRHLEKQFFQQKIHQLEEELQMQKQHLKKKTKTLQETNSQLESIRQSSTDLENQVKVLRKNVENFEETQKEYEQQAQIYQEQIKSLQNENLKLKTELDNEKDTLLIKNKIIEDQQETIKQLKEKFESEKNRKESLERILNTEREEKLELEEALERLKCRKEELKKKIKDLEDDLQLAPQKVAEDLQKTQTVLFELENQVYSKQKEWELQLHSLIREKEQACSIAEYATRKLIQTTSEFQKQSEAHKRFCRILTENLDKENR